MKTLKLPDDDIFETWREANPFQNYLLRNIYDGAPNLQELKNVFCLDLIKNVPTEKLQIFKNIQLPYIWYEDPEILIRMNQFCTGELTLHTLCTDLPRSPSNDLRMDNYWTLLFDVICSNSGSLKNVTLGSHSTFMLRHFARRMQALPNVTSLEFELPRMNHSAISQFLTPVPLREIFPSVTAVKIRCCYHLDEVDVEDNEVFSWPAVTEVTCREYELTDPGTRELAILFPNLRSLSLFGDGNTPGHSLRNIWPWLHSLEHLCVTVTPASRDYWDDNFDAAFCGIYEAEAAILRKKDDMYLKTVNIVPPFPPINYLRGKVELV